MHNRTGIGIPGHHRKLPPQNHHHNIMSDEDDDTTTTRTTVPTAHWHFQLRLHLVRHGETVANLQENVIGQSDSVT